MRSFCGTVDLDSAGRWKFFRGSEQHVLRDDRSVYPSVSKQGNDGLLGYHEDQHSESPFLKFDSVTYIPLRGQMYLLLRTSRPLLQCPMRPPANELHFSPRSHPGNVQKRAAPSPCSCDPFKDHFYSISHRCVNF